MENDINELVGERCPDFEPGCAVCDAWHAFDLHAYGALAIEITECKAWYAEYYCEEVALS